MLDKNYWKLLGFLVIFTACGSDDPTPPDPELHPVVSTDKVKVLDYAPAPGQFVNELPKYDAGNTLADMIAKVQKYIDNTDPVTLGSWGGSITFRLSQPIKRVEGRPSFRVLGNAFYSTESETPPHFGSSEPGIILVMTDTNGNGLPDDEWFEISGSETANSLSPYTVTYNRPASEPEEYPAEGYIKWTAGNGDKGSITKLEYHTQPYYPQWVSSSTLTFSGRRLPDNGVYDEETGLYNLKCYDYGYADSQPNHLDASLIYLDWAIKANGLPANVKQIDFIKVYTGVLQENGWLGECSTEVCGVQRIDYVAD
ncbi:MAG: PKD domain-containing protein [Muribaculaceae bacterium]|nr:PKD domain-containing protein [Muribaculaceae bacterium]